MQANLRIIGLASFLLVAFTRPVTAAHLATAKRKQIESAVSTFMVRNNLPGVAVAVVENGNYEWAEGFGMADLENSIPVTIHTLSGWRRSRSQLLRLRPCCSMNEGNWTSMRQRRNIARHFL